MTDFHAHLLPGIDDGSDSVETSLGMLDLWREQGIQRICCTPHFYADHNTPERFLRRRGAAHEALSRAMDPAEEYPVLLLGAEVHFFSGMSSAQDLPRLCLQGTDLLLLEMPFTRWTDHMLGEVEDICHRGIQPVAAHIERYMALNPRRILQRFYNTGVMIQSNAEFFLDRRTTRKALRMLRDGTIQILGSDAHNLQARKPNLGPALELIGEKLGQATIQNLREWGDFFIGAEESA